jgi:hypothetical protein
MIGVGVYMKDLLRGFISRHRVSVGAVVPLH